MEDLGHRAERQPFFLTLMLELSFAGDVDRDGPEPSSKDSPRL